MFSAMRIGVMAKKGAAAITVAAAEATTYANAANTTLTLPSGVQVGELLLAFVSCAANSTTGLSTSSSGWVKEADAVAAWATTCAALFSKVATGSDALVVSTGTSRVVDAVCYRIQNANSCEATSNYGLTSGSIATPPTITLSQSRDFLCISSAAMNGAYYFTGYPSGYSSLVETSAAAGRYHMHTVRKGPLTGTSETPGTWSTSNASARFVTLTAAIYQS